MPVVRKGRRKQSTYDKSARLASRMSMSNPPPPGSPKVSALVVAAGRGNRAGLDIPKQYAVVGGKTVLRRTLEALLSHGSVGDILVVIGDGDDRRYNEAVLGLMGLLPPVRGGASRQMSVRNGLEALASQAPDIVL